MKKHLLLCSFLLSLFLGPILSAQEPRIDLQFLSLDDGLSDRRVNSICQSPDGFIWLATDYGLNRYDGQYFKTYSQKTHRLVSDEITKVFATKDNLLWLFYGLVAGNVKDLKTWNFTSLNIFDIEKETLVPLSDIFANGGYLPSGFRGGQVDEAGDLWLWTKAGEVFYYDGTWQKKLTLPDHGRIDCVMPTGKGDFWLSYDKKLLRFNGAGILMEEEQLSFYVEALRQDDAGVLWISPYRLIDKGLPKGSHLYYKRVGEPVNNYSIPDETSIIEKRLPSQFSCTRVDEKGRIWVFSGVEVELIDPGSQKVTHLKFDIQEISDSRRFTEFYFGEEDLIFLGSDDGFLIIEMNQYLFKTYLNDESPPPSTRAILDYTEDSLLVFTYGNIFVIHKENGGQRILPQYEGYNFYGGIMDANGQIWGGSHTMDLTQMDPKTGEHQMITLQHSPKRNMSALRPFQDVKTGRIWIGCSKGLSYYDPGEEYLQRFEPGSAYPEFNRFEVNGFHQNEEGLWICTGNGVYLYKEGKGIIDAFNDFPYANINHIYEDKDHVFWLSTLGGGLIRWDQKKEEMRQFTTEEGLSNNTIYTAFEDDYDQLWLPSNNGLMRFDKKSFTLITYFPFDGIPHEEFNNVSYCRTADGRLYFGGINGFLSLDPELMINHVFVNADLLVTDFKKSDPSSGRLIDAKATYDALQKIRMEPGENSFQLHYALLDYKGKQQINYAYQIEGLDENWIYTHENFVLIHRLPYGNYNLRIKGQGGGKWSDKELNIPLLVIKPLHKKVWFIALVALLAFGLGGYLVRWRIRFLKKEKMRLELEVRKRTEQIKEQNERLEAMNETKDQFFSIIAHDLRGPMLSFRGLNKKFRYLIANKQEDRLEELEQSVESAYQRLERLLDNLLKWALVQKGNLPFYPESLELHDFTNEVIALYQDLAKVNGIAIVNQIEKPMMVFADSDALSSIFRNLLNNAITYSLKETQISIRASRTEKMLVCIVEDQGAGIAAEDLESLLDFDPQKRKRKSKKGGTGLGLQLCKELVELHGGEINIESQAGIGTSVSFLIPHQTN